MKIDEYANTIKVLAVDEQLPHTKIIERLLREGRGAEAKKLHAAYVDQQLKAAQHGPINLSDLMAGREAFILDEIDREEKGAKP